MNKQTYFLPVNRYYFDNKLHVADGWSQIDGMCNELIINCWKSLGFERDLH